jgi:hypothetical protein
VIPQCTVVMFYDFVTFVYFHYSMFYEIKQPFNANDFFSSVFVFYERQNKIKFFSFENFQQKIAAQHEM